MIENPEGTQPSKPIAPKKRGRKFLINALILLAVLTVAVFAGYNAGIEIRKNYKSASLLQQVGEQYQYALVDIEFERYDIARQRLEFIIANDPSFPGAQEKLTEVLVKINMQQGYQSPTPLPSLTSTPDFSGVEEAYSLASRQIAAQDWTGALSTLDELRKLDPNYNQSQVDGMYYFALRNYGYDLIARQGNLEGGIYQLTLAERFGTLDREANGLREGARIYIIGASFWELDWKEALSYFEQARNWGNLWDGTMTANDRYWFASMRYGDEFFAKEKFCDAVTQYQNAQTVSVLDKTAQENYAEAMTICFPPTATIDLTVTATPTTGIATTEVPTNTPEPPTETPTPPTP